MFPYRYYGGIDIEVVREELCAEKSLKNGKILLIASTIHVLLSPMDVFKY
jgi:hypothetical protein